VIEAKNISGGYDGKEIIHGLSFEIPDGKLTAVVGPNGCGKSTLLKMLCAAVPVKTGQVFIDGKEMKALGAKPLARSVSFLNQNRDTPEISVARLVLHGRFPWIGYPRTYRQEDQDIAENAMRKAGIFEKRGFMMSRLSGGERQKAYIAMNLAQSTGNLLLDEPTTFLDISSQLELMNILAAIKAENKAVAAVVHDLRLAFEFADMMAVMREGTLTFAGSPEEAAASGSLEDAFGIKIKRGEQYLFRMA
jgi:iron complex transport system ATP-binding protein